MTDVALDAAKVDRAEAELNAFIERRTSQRDKVNAEAGVWAASERKHRERIHWEKWG